MRVSPRLTLIFSLFTIHSFMYAQSETKEDCPKLKNIKMLDISSPNAGYVVIDDSIHIEYVEDEKYFIKSKLEWINDCEYNATVMETTWPEFNFPMGEVMHAKVIRTQNDTLYFEVQVRDFKFETPYKLIH